MKKILAGMALYFMFTFLFAGLDVRYFSNFPDFIRTEFTTAPSDSTVYAFRLSDMQPFVYSNTKLAFMGERKEYNFGTNTANFSGGLNMIGNIISDTTRTNELGKGYPIYKKMNLVQAEAMFSDATGIAPNCTLMVYSQTPSAQLRLITKLAWANRIQFWDNFSGVYADSAEQLMVFVKSGVGGENPDRPLCRLIFREFLPKTP